MGSKKRSNKHKTPRKAQADGDGTVSNTRVRESRDQYQHTIPRFILRRFQGGPRKSKAERVRGFQRTGVDPDEFLYYDLETKVLESRSIGTVFGVKNMYRDVRNTDDVDELERKLAYLENTAAASIVQLHKDLSKGQSTLSRKEIDSLRKFLFLMHYRGQALSLSYFDPTQNDGAGSWIERIQEQFGLTSSMEVWLHFLRYYLDTPHHQIIAHAQKEVDKFGMNGINKMLLTSRLDPSMEHHEAIAYYNQAEHFHLCVWQAAEGEEFVLGTQAFGLWEGTIAGAPHLHRLFIVSPQLAIVLRGNALRTKIPELWPLLRSEFLDINQEPPIPKYASATRFETMEDLALHKASAAAQRDTFTLKFTKLTPTQTTAVNFVLLENATPTSAFTFVSKAPMLKTIQAFCRSPELYRIPRRAGYAPLITTLRDELTSSEPGERFQRCIVPCCIL